MSKKTIEKINSILGEYNFIENETNACVYRKKINLMKNLEMKIERLRSYARENELPIFKDESRGELSVEDIHNEIKCYNTQIDNLIGLGA